jgi:hypothetical protein
LEDEGMDAVTVGSVEQFQGEVRTIIFTRQNLRNNGHIIGAADYDNVHRKKWQGRRLATRARICPRCSTHEWCVVRHYFKYPSQLQSVSFTRAMALLIIIGNPNVLSKGHYWRSFLEYVHKQGGWTGKPLSWQIETDTASFGGEVLPTEEYSTGDEFTGGIRSHYFREI